MRRPLFPSKVGRAGKSIEKKIAETALTTSLTFSSPWKAILHKLSKSVYFKVMAPKKLLEFTDLHQDFLLFLLSEGKAH